MCAMYAEYGLRATGAVEVSLDETNVKLFASGCLAPET